MCLAGEVYVPASKLKVRRSPNPDPPQGQRAARILNAVILTLQSPREKYLKEQKKVPKYHSTVVYDRQERKYGFSSTAATTTG
jgi:hypothetical protein